MAKRLQDALKSSYIEKLKYFRNKNKPWKILVFVEDDDDVVFWKLLFKQYENQKIVFKVRTPCHDSFEHSKKQVLERIKRWNGLCGKFFVGCVDSDYDYLADETTKRSTLICNNPFIFQTYTYSIENYLCYAESLCDIVLKIVRKDIDLPDFESLLKEISNSVYPLLLWSVLFYTDENPDSFAPKDITRIIRLPGRINPDEYDAVKQRIQENAISKENELKRDHSHLCLKIEEFARELEKKGLTRENAYLFLKGHTLFNSLIVPLLSSIVTSVQTERFEEISSKAKSSEERQNRINKLRNESGDVTSVVKQGLFHNTNYTDCFLYKKIEEDIKKYLKTSFP